MGAPQHKEADGGENKNKLGEPGESYQKIEPAGVGIGVGVIRIFDDPRLYGSGEVNVHTVRLEGNDDDKVEYEGTTEDGCQNEMQDVFKIHVRFPFARTARFKLGAIAETTTRVALNTR